MATSQQFLPFDNSSLTNFKAWAQAISSFIGSTAHWMQASDTGQVDWSTIASVPATGSYVYEIWGMADSLQATAPIFLKIEYGTQATNVPGLRVSLGTATTGSGSLTGYTTTSYVINDPPGAQGSSTFECDLSGDTNRLSLLLWRTVPPRGPTVLTVERTHNTDGSDSSDGAIAILAWGPFSQNIQIQLIAGQGEAFPSTAVNLPTRATLNSSSAFANRYTVYPAIPDYGGLGSYLFSFLVLRSPDAIEGNTFTTDAYGTSHTYLVTKNVGSGSWGAAIRYD